MWRIIVKWILILNERGGINKSAVNLVYGMIERGVNLVYGMIERGSKLSRHVRLAKKGLEEKEWNAISKCFLGQAKGTSLKENRSYIYCY